MSQFVTAAEAVRHIPDGATVAVGGFCGFGSPDEVLIALRERFDATGAPKNLTLFKGVSIGDKGERGCSRIAREGLVGRVICAHVGLEPAMAALIEQDKCLAYLLPLGPCTELLRAAAAHRPGVLTRCGLETFADPRTEGSKANAATRAHGADIVSLMELDGEKCLYYRTLPIQACIVRGTYADTDGNIVLDREALQSDQFEAAAAAHNSGGIVIVQVEDVVPAGTLDPRNVRLHHFMVDYVVKAQPKNHLQGYDDPNYRPELTGEARSVSHTVDPETIQPLLFVGRKQAEAYIKAAREFVAKRPAMPLNDRKVCGRRAALELRAGTLINLGIGMPDAVAAVAEEEGVADRFTLSIESGVLGGVPLTGLGLGASTNPEAIYKMADILNIYDGGGLDTAVLGLAEIDAQGNVNVSKFGGRVTGPGGFIDIAQNTGTVIFTGTFTAGGLQTSYDGGTLRILREGRAMKFKQQVEQISFSGSYAVRTGKRVLVVTERAVFSLTQQGLELIELAPGIDLERDVLAHMAFLPRISPDLRQMDARIFRDEPMGLTI